MNTNINWTAVVAAALSGLAIVTSLKYPDLSVAIGLSAVTNAVLALRLD